MFLFLALCISLILSIVTRDTTSNLKKRRLCIFSFQIHISMYFLWNFNFQVFLDYLPITVNHERTLHFRAFAVDCCDIVLIHSFAIAKVANTDTFQNDFSSLFLWQVFGRSNFLHFVTEKQGEEIQFSFFKHTIEAWPKSKIKSK